MSELATIGDDAAAGAQRTSSATRHQIASLGELAEAAERLAAAVVRLTASTKRFRVDGKS